MCLPRGLSLPEDLKFFLLLSRLLRSVGDIDQRDVCLFFNIMELDGTQFVVFKDTFEKLNSNSHVPITADQS